MRINTKQKVVRGSHHEINDYIEKGWVVKKMVSSGEYLIEKTVTEKMPRKTG